MYEFHYDRKLADSITIVFLIGDPTTKSRHFHSRINANGSDYTNCVQRYIQRYS